VTSRLDLDEANRRALAALRHDGGETSALLVQLLATACLLELRRLLTAGLDLPTFVTAAVDTLAQLASINHCQLEVSISELAPVSYGVGLGPGDEPDLVSAPVTLDGVPVGTLRAGALPQPVRDAGLLEQLAAEISAGLDTLVQSERRRREPAMANALELAATLDEHYDVSHLQGIADALAALPNVGGATVVMENPRFAGALAVQGGAPATAGLDTRHAHTIDGRIGLRVVVRWLRAPEAPDERQTREAVEAFVSTLERIEANLRLHTEAEVDELTGIANRRSGQRALAAACTWARHNGSSVSVLLLDLDRFKQVNDTLGHEVGDLVLSTFAQSLTLSTREYDHASRWGGEEFLVVLPGVDVVTALRIAERLRTQTPGMCADALPPEWRQTVSVGVATFPDDAEEPSRLVRIADEALYDAKAGGRDRVASGGRNRV
jgi:diguanylate cyclase (GGDEF)-like protein